MSGEKKRYCFVRHEDDEFYDEVRLVGMVDDPILRCIVRYRFKTSGMSGDEWRVGSRWELFRGDCWQDFDRGSFRLRDALGYLYGGVYQDHPDLHDIMIRSIDFYRKDHKLFVGTCDGVPTRLLDILGHLPWAWVSATEGEGEGLPTEHFPDDNDYCFQPGCAKKAVSTYRIKKKFCRSCGEGKESALMPGTLGYARRFCRLHLRRGDCGLDDADANYEVVDGPGPDDARGADQFESKAVLGGVIDLRDQGGETPTSTSERENHDDDGQE